MSNTNEISKLEKLEAVVYTYYPVNKENTFKIYLYRIDTRLPIPVPIDSFEYLNIDNRAGMKGAIAKHLLCECNINTKTIINI